MYAFGQTRLVLLLDRSLKRVNFRRVLLTFGIRLGKYRRHRRDLCRGHAGLEPQEDRNDH